uniref:Ribosomal protein L21 n=1 Tax=Selaginella nipponica TaxID=872861 RepID=A0A7U3VIA2_9TRAC|nr:ribosomal protein L21 [Selaginella nipponica]QQP00263.1 ribosomal protein L21 [Selaginella nipponica]
MIFVIPPAARVIRTKCEPEYQSVVLTYRVLMICHESTRNEFGAPLGSAAVKGRILHPLLGDHTIAHGMRSGGKGAQKRHDELRHRQDLARSVP